VKGIKMINKIAFTPAVSAVDAPEKNINFKGALKEEAKEDNSGLLYGSLAVLSAFGLGMLLRKPKVVEKEVVKVVEKPVKEAVKNNTARIPKRKKIKYTTPNRNPKPISNKREAEIVNNIDTKSANNQSRKLADEASKDTVTPEMQAVYDREIAYQAPNAEQKRDIANLHKKNKAERAKKNSIGNLAQKPKPKVSKLPVENPELKSIEGSISALKARIAGAKRFGKDTSKYEAQLNKLIEKRNNLLNSTQNKV